MKKLITICLLLITVYTAKGQTFEETVGYINEKLQCCSIDYSDANYKTTSITANRNGIISVKRSDNIEYKIDLLSLYETPELPPVYLENDQIIFRITLNKLKIWRIVSNQEGDRIVKALLHLKSVCKKDKELFDK